MCKRRPSSALKIFTVHIPTVELYIHVHSDTSLSTTSICFIQRDPAKIHVCTCVYTLLCMRCVVLWLLKRHEPHKARGMLHAVRMVHGQLWSAVYSEVLHTRSQYSARQ